MKKRLLLPAMLLVVVNILFSSCSELAKKVAMKALNESAEFEKEDTVKWGNVVEQDLDLPPFFAIDAKGAVRIVFVQDSTFSVRVRGNKKCVEAYKYEVRKDELKVEPKDFNGKVKKSSPAVTLFICAPCLYEVDIEGAGKLELTGSIAQAGSLEIDIAGAGEITVDDLAVTDLSIELNGAGKCDIAKVTATGDIEIEVNGAGELNANVFCQELSVELNGAGNAVLSGECKKLRCEENGASKIDYSKLNR